MPNIAITTYCNLQCPYCFANKMITTEKIKNITIDQFKKTLDWLGHVNGHIGIIGGEPVLHPQFNEILNLLKEYNKTYPDVHFVLFTNGIYLHNFLQDIPKQMNLLINVNTPTSMIKNQYEDMLKNIDKLYKMGWLATNNNENVRATLGCNICQEIDDYAFFWDIVKKYKIKVVRVSVTAPTNELYKKNKYMYYHSMKEKFLNFAKIAKENNTTLHKDCNQIPLCFFNKDELKLVEAVCGKEDSNFHICRPVIDITPDFKASSCFGAYDLIDCKDFNNLEQIENYFLFKKMWPKIKNNTDKPCEDCKFHELLKCQGGCLAFSHF